VRAFRDALVKLRFKGLAHAPFDELIGETEQGAVNRKTSQKYFRYFVAACNWWIEEGLMQSSPVGNVTVAVPKGKKSGERVAFTPADLKTLFSSPMYVGCQGPARRMKPGPKKIRDDRDDPVARAAKGYVGIRARRIQHDILRHRQRSAGEEQEDGKECTPHTFRPEPVSSKSLRS
jgi:hypothetical protein